MHKQLSEQTKKEPKSLSGDDVINIDELKIINNWSEDYYKTIKNIYTKIIIFLNGKCKAINDKINTNKNDIIRELMTEPINIEEFIFKTYNSNKASFDHRASRVRRIIRWILNDDKWDFKNIKIHEKLKRKKNIIDINELNLIFTSLSEESNKTIYLIAILTLILGLSLRIISKIKKKNIFLNSGTLSVYQNKNRIRRNISFSLSSFLKDYFETYNLKENDFLIYNDYKEKKSLSREKHIKNIFSNVIIKIYSTNKNKISTILKLINRNRLPLNSIEYIFENNKFFIKKLINNEDDSNNKNYIVNENECMDINKSDNKFYDFNLKSICYKDDNSNALFNNDSFSKDKSSLFGFDFEECNLKSFQILKKNLEFSSFIPFEYNSNKELSTISNNNDYFINKLNFNYLPLSFNDKNDYTSSFIKNILKSFNIEFTDFVNSDYGDIKLKKNIGNLEDYKFNNFNLYFYNQMKKNTTHGFYMGLKMKKIGKVGYNIQASCDIEENTLLFEVGGEIVTQEFLDKNKEMIRNKKHCYFYLLDKNRTKDSKIILLMNKANIAIFIRKTESSKSNVLFSPYIKDNNQFGLLCISEKKIKNKEIICSNKILKI